MIIRNHTNKAIPLPSGQTIPANGEVSVSDSDWSDMSANVVVKAWIKAKLLAAIDEPVQESQHHNYGDNY